MSDSVAEKSSAGARVQTNLARAFSVREDQFDYIRMIVIAAVVGVLAAVGNLAFRWLIATFSWVFRNWEWHQLGIAPHSYTRLLIPVVLLSGGAVLYLLHWLFPGDVLGYGFPDFLAMIHLGGGKIKRRWIFIKGLGASISLGCGASVGREGPIAQIGGTIGAAVAEITGLGRERLKLLVACGAGAGIATTFNAPIGGLLFAQEIVLLGETELAHLSLLVIATTTAVVTARSLTGDEVIFPVVPFELASDWELITYAAMGVVMGLLAVGYIRLFYGISGIFRRIMLPPWVRLGLGLFLVGLIAIPLPENLSDGYPFINAAFHGQLPTWKLGALALAKMLGSSISLGCGAPGGVFGPIFFIGTMAGGFFRAVSAALVPWLTGPRGSYALLGLGTFLAAVTHAPLTAIFLLFEMSRNYAITLPILMSSILATIVSRSLERESIDTYALALQGKSLEIGRERLVLKQIPVTDVMVPEATSIPAQAPLSDVLRTAGESGQGTLAVVDREGNLVGVIVARDLLSLLASGGDLGPLVNAYDICQMDPPAVTADSTLDEALNLMDAEGLNEIPVVENSNGRQLVGSVTRQAIAQALSRAAISMSAMAGPENDIMWSSGYRVMRIVVPPNAAGKTMRSLEPRQRFGVSVLAIQSSSQPNSGFVLADPDRPLSTGDIIIAAGRSSALRHFRRELETG